MKTTSLGGEGLLTSSVGLGCMGMSQGYGQADDNESLTTLNRAIGNGARLEARPERVRSYCEASLARLGTDHIDLYYLHRGDPHVPHGQGRVP